jgi:hypothetical protein
MKPIKYITILLLLLALMIAPSCDNLEVVNLDEEPAPVFVKPVYTDNGNGTVSDTTANGIMWERCAYGETGSDCSGDYATTYSYSVSKNYCDNQTTGGYSDWRLPTLSELKTLTYSDVTYGWFQDYDLLSPLPNPPAVLKGQYWWSSTMENVNFVYALRLSDKDAVYSAVDGPTTRYVRCVRAIQP